MSKELTLNLSSFCPPILQESFFESDLNRNPQNYIEVCFDFTDWQEAPWWREFENL